MALVLLGLACRSAGERPPAIGTGGDGLPQTAVATQALTPPVAANTFVDSSGRQVPAGWLCSPLYYGAGAADGCDCACGEPDPDCAIEGAVRYCHVDGRSRQVDDCSQCTIHALFGDGCRGP